MNESELRQFICSTFLRGDLELPVGRETKLVEEGLVDSLGLVQIAGELERRSPGLRVNDQEITRDNFGSIAAILRFLESKRG